MLEFNLIDIIFTVINLLILYLLMRKFLFGPVTKMIESRQQEIEHNLAAAEDQRVQATGMRDEL